jgi:hypothetical protein
MITVRRQSGRVGIMVWGNADEELQRHQELLAKSFAEAGGGVVRS